MRKTEDLVKMVIRDVGDYCSHEDIPEHRTDAWPSEACTECNKLIESLLVTLAVCEMEALERMERIANAHRTAAASTAKEALYWKNEHDRLIAEGWVRA